METLSFLRDLWELAKSAGPFGTLLMLYLFHKSDKERRDSQAQLSAVSLAQTKAAVALESTLRARTEAMRAMEGALNSIIQDGRKPKNGRRGTRG